MSATSFQWLSANDNLTPYSAGSTSSAWSWNQTYSANANSCLPW